MINSDYDDLFEYLVQLENDEFEGYTGITYENGKEHLSYRVQSDEFYAIELKENCKVIGNIYCGKRDFESREVVYIINKNYQCHGYASEVLSAVIRKSFNNGIHRIYAECDPRNICSWKLLEKVGMEREAFFYKNIYFYRYEGGNPIWKDTYVYATLNEQERRTVRIETERLVIRDLERKDQEQLFKIVWQKNVVRFMRDWSENNPNPESFDGYVDWHQSQKDSTNVYECKRYAITVKGEDKCIGTVGMGFEDTVNEVEMAYFLDEEYQGNGYATEALLALFEWCMKVSDLKYLILTIDEANEASCRVAERAGFELFEKRYPISHKQPNMESDCYYYYRKYR